MKPRHESMSLIIAEQSLKGSRSKTTREMREWYDGRANAAALIHPCLETLAAANECRFLIGYHLRHNHV